MCVCDLYMAFIAHPADYIKGAHYYKIAMYIPFISILAILYHVFTDGTRKAVSRGLHMP
jgi:hypothetical protein